MIKLSWRNGIIIKDFSTGKEMEVNIGEKWRFLHRGIVKYVTGEIINIWESPSNPNLSTIIFQADKNIKYKVPAYYLQEKFYKKGRYKKC